MTKHRVKFTRSAFNVSLEEMTRAAEVLGLRHHTIVQEPGPTGSPFWTVEADEELEVLMDVEEGVHA